MRPSLALLLTLLSLPGSAEASVRVLAVEPAGPVVAGRPVDLVVRTDVPVDAALLTFPDLQGTFGATRCALHGGGSRQTVLRYRPEWAGLHSLQLSVTAGACGPRPQTHWRVVEIEAAPAGAPAPAPQPACRHADEAPTPRTMRAARIAVVCLLNAERSARGVPRLVPDESLRRIASASAHGAPRRPRRGEQRTVTPEAPPADVLHVWLASHGHRRDLLAPDVRRVGVAVVTRFPEPLRRAESTYVVVLG